MPRIRGLKFWLIWPPPTKKDIDMLWLLLAVVIYAVDEALNYNEERIRNLDRDFG